MLVTFFIFILKNNKYFCDGGSISQAYLSLIILIIILAIRFALCEQKKKNVMCWSDKHILIDMALPQ
jgi:hypothetical protein